MKKSFLLWIIFLFVSNLFFPETIEFSAGYMEGQAGKTNTTTVLEENAFIKTETMEVYADRIELSGKDFRYIKAIGNVDGKNLESKMDFSCGSLEYDRELKKAVLKGDVVFIDLENNVEAEAEIIEYDQEKDIAVFQINVNLKQDDNICSGAYCIYFKGEQLMELSGNAQVKQKENVFRAQHISLNLETEEISLGGNVKGSVKDTKEAKKEDTSDVKPDGESGEKVDVKSEEGEKEKTSESNDNPALGEDKQLADNQLDDKVSDTKENINNVNDSVPDNNPDDKNDSRQKNDMTAEVKESGGKEKTEDEKEQKPSEKKKNKNKTVIIDNRKRK